MIWLITANCNPAAASTLLKYFDEDYPADELTGLVNCGACDVCLTEVEKFDGTLIAQKLLSAVSRLKGQFGSSYVVDFLRGSKSEKIRPEHRELKTYGIGAGIGKADWLRYIREIAALGYLELTGGLYPLLQLTAKSELVLKGKQQVELVASQTTEEYKPAITLPYETSLFDET